MTLQFGVCFACVGEGGFWLWMVLDLLLASCGLIFGICVWFGLVFLWFSLVLWLLVLRVLGLAVFRLAALCALFSLMWCRFWFWMWFGLLGGFWI